MNNLVVKSIYTTDNESSSDKGAMTLTCQVGDKTVDIRTAVLKDADGNIITAEYFEGKTIDVRGVVDRFDGRYQIKVFNLNDITVK
jgi:DNA/RNA endonuclease YhcR with UshA esterase domain